MERTVRRRRIVAITLLVGVLGVAAAFVAGAAWPDPPAPIESDAKRHPPAPAEPGEDVETCSAEELDVALAADRATVEEGEPVGFTVTLRNGGTTPCLVDGGEVNGPVTVWAGERGGGDRVWSSGDCADGERMLLLGPGFSDSREVEWSGGRSAPGCGEAGGKVPPGGYSAQVTVSDADGATSDVVPLERLASPEPSPTPSKKPKAGEEPEPGATPGKGSGSSSPGGEPQGAGAAAEGTERGADAADEVERGGDVAGETERGGDAGAERLSPSPDR